MFSGNNMISFDPLWNSLKERGMSIHSLHTKYKISTSMINRMRHNGNLTLQNVNKICSLLDLNIDEVIKYVPDSSDLDAVDREAKNALKK